MGLTLAGNNAGGVLMSPLSAALIRTIGWRSTFLVTGAVLLVVTSAVVYFFMRDKVEDVATSARKAGRREEYEAAELAIAERAARGGGSAPSSGSALAGWDWRSAIGTGAFWLIAAVQIASVVSIFAVLSQLSNHLGLAGIDLTTAGWAPALLGFFGLFGKLLFGWAAQRWPVRYAFAVCLLLQACGVLLLMLVTSPQRTWVLLPFLAVYGLGFGAVGALKPLIIVETFGLFAFGTIIGLVPVLTPSPTP